MIILPKNKQQGFTIVELLIVIVVIAILAAITLVAFNGITNKSREASLQSSLKQVQTQVANYKTLNGAFPTSLAVLNDGQGPKGGSDMRFIYTLEGSDYCVTLVSTATPSMYNTCGNNGTISSGSYSGHADLIAGYPTRGGFTDITNAEGQPNTILASINSVPVGGWMVVVLANFQVDTPLYPAGWTPLAVLKSAGTLHVSAYGKIKQAGDADAQEFEIPNSSASRNFVNAAFIWGKNSDTVADWVVGQMGDRTTPGATSTSVIVPSNTVSKAKSLVLSIASERTTAAETNYTSLTGVNPWVWIPQPTGNANKIQTIAVGYDEQANAGASKTMTVTYPNGQAANGLGFQIIIPPAS